MRERDDEGFGAEIRCLSVRRRCHRVGGRVARRVRRDLPGPQRHGDHPVRAGQRQRHHRAHPVRAARQAGRPGLHHRQPRRRRRHHRRRPGRARHAGRLHHPVPLGLVQLGVCDAQDAALRHVQGFHRGGAGRHFAERARGVAVERLQNRRRSGRRRQGEARCAELRLRRASARRRISPRKNSTSPPASSRSTCRSRVRSRR